jgi:hypothetical protein
VSIARDSSVVVTATVTGNCDSDGGGICAGSMPGGRDVSDSDMATK